MVCPGTYHTVFTRPTRSRVTRSPCLLQLFPPLIVQLGAKFVSESVGFSASLLDTMSSISSLPEEVLKLVLKHVPLQDRLGSCCLVSTRMHAAAVAATEKLQLQQ